MPARTLLLLANPLMVAMLACRSEPVPGDAGGTVEPARPRGVARREARQLLDAERRYREHARRRAIVHRAEHASKLVVEGGRFADEGRVVDREPRAEYRGQGDDLEQIERLTREQRDALSFAQVVGMLEVLPHPLQVTPHRVPLLPAEATLLQPLELRLDPVLQLDEVLAAASVARLELEVARHDPVLARPEVGQPVHDWLQRGGFARGTRRGATA
jgi:hypothetical protein